MCLSSSCSFVLFHFLPCIFASSFAGSKHLTLSRRSTYTAANITSPLLATTFGAIFDVNVTIGNQTLPLTVDTGSSDLWVVRTDYECFNLTDGTHLSQGSCLFGSATYTPTSTYSEVEGQDFGVQYGAGVASGNMAIEQVTLAGITVPSQKIGVVNQSTPLGDGVGSGLIGLAYPALTSAHPSNDTDNSTFVYDRLPYTPLLFSMAKQGLIKPYFSMALARTPQNTTSGFGGYLSLGGLPPVNHTGNFTTVAVETTNSIPLNVTSNTPGPSYWSFTLSGVAYGLDNSSNLSTTTTRFQAFMDSGNYFTYLPSSIIEPVNALFSPAAVLDPSTGIYMVDCSATPPHFGLIIGNDTFFHNGRDLIFQTGAGQCASNLAISQRLSPELPEFNVIGEPFLKNVLSVYDFGKNELSFAKLTGEVVEGAPGGVVAEAGENGAMRSIVSRAAWGWKLFIMVLLILVTKMGLF